MRGCHCKWVIIGPPTKRHLNGVWLVCQWWPNIECWLSSFVIFQGIQTSVAKKHFISVIFFSFFFWGGGPDPLSPPPPPSGSVHVTANSAHLKYLPKISVLQYAIWASDFIINSCPTNIFVLKMLSAFLCVLYIFKFTSDYILSWKQTLWTKSDCFWSVWPGSILFAIEAT